MLTTAQIEKIITDAENSDEAQSLIRSPASIAAEKIAELTKSDHNMLLAAQALENEVTSTLLDMLAATILSTLIEEEGGGRTNISFSPNSMNYMTKHYTYESKIEGLTRTVSIQMREDSPLRQDMEAWTEPSNRHGVALDPWESPRGAKPQAEPRNYGGPHWVVAINDPERGLRFLNCHDRADAERQYKALPADKEVTAVIQNRYCLHPECPSTGCTKEKPAEVTS